MLRATACREAGIPEWLFEESYQAVGDLAETIAHLLPAPDSVAELGLAVWIEQRLLPLRGQGADLQADALAAWWRELDTPGRFLLTKLIGGGFRVGVSKLLVQRALAEAFGVDAKMVAQRLMGYTDAKAMPSAAGFTALHSAQGAVDVGQPYPFFLAHALPSEGEPLAMRLGALSSWLVEWKYDGIRAQVVRRQGQTWIWSRGEELMTDRFPEVVALAQALPDGSVLDGEILVWQDGAPAPFQRLQQRIGRKNLTKKLLAEAPVTFMAYDLLEWQGNDQRALTMLARRVLLEQLCGQAHVPLSPRVQADDWPALAALREQARARGVEGFMLKAVDSSYGSGRTKAGGTWWKWKVDPLSVDCVLIYAQAGHGRRASVYTDYSFAVWNRSAARRRRSAGRGRGDRAARTGVARRIATGGLCQGLFGPERCRVRAGGQGHPCQHAGEVRPGAQCQADSRVRVGIRRREPQPAPQERHRGALPAHAAHPRGQAAA